MKKNKNTLKRILSLVGKYPLSVIAVILFAAAEVAATLYVPILVGDGVDLITGKGAVDFDGLSAVFLKIGIAIAVGFVAKWLVGIFNNRLAFHVVQNIRDEAFDKITSLPLKYLDSHPHGDTLSRIVADADEVSDGLVMGFTQLFTGVLTIGGTIALMLLTNWKIALVVIFVTPLSIFTSRFIAKRTYSFFRKQTLARAGQVSFTEEAVGNLKTAQAFAHEKKNEEDFAKYNGNYKEAAMNATFYSSLTNPLTRFLNNAVYALVVLFGALQIASGTGGLTVGGLTKFLSYANQYTKPFNEISGVITELSGAFVCAARIFELLDEQEEVSDENNAELTVTEGKVDLGREFRLYGRAETDRAFIADGGRRQADRDRGADRLRQDDADQPSDALLRRERRGNFRGFAGDSRRDEKIFARALRYGASGDVFKDGYGARKSENRAGERDGRRDGGSRESLPCARIYFPPAQGVRYGTDGRSESFRRAETTFVYRENHAVASEYADSRRGDVFRGYAHRKEDFRGVRQTDDGAHLFYRGAPPFHDTERRYYSRDGKGQRGGAGKSRNAAEKTRILLRSVYEPVCGNRRRGEPRRIRLRKKAADLCDPSRFLIYVRRWRFCARMPFLSYGAADFATLFAFSPRPS